MMQFQTQDETGFLEIETGGSVFFRDRDGDEHYLEWEDLSGELQEFLSRFVEDAESAFDEALGALHDSLPDASEEYQEE